MATSFTNFDEVIEETYPSPQGIIELPVHSSQPEVQIHPPSSDSISPRDTVLEIERVKHDHNSDNIDLVPVAGGEE